MAMHAGSGSFPGHVRPISLRYPALWWAGGGSLALFAVVLIDAMTRPLAFYDVAVANDIQGIDIPHLWWWVDFVNHEVTASTPSVMAWAVLMLVLVATRWWSAALTAALMPAGGIVAEFVSRVMVSRTRPHLEELIRGSSDFEERSFPSGHVVGAVLLYGLIFVLLRRVRWRLVRLPLQALCATLIVVVGFARIWSGAHWPSDVVGAYPLGFAMLAVLIGIFFWLDDGGLATVQQRVGRAIRDRAPGSSA